jgi:polar amino acid transport system substrate-binding protein
MKKLLSLLLITTVLLSGCGTTTETTGTETELTALEKVIESGVLKVGVSPDYPPMEFFDSENNAVGSDVTLAQYIAEQLGVELQIETMDFSAVLTGVDLNKVDLGISGFGWTEERKENYLLSTSYNTDAAAESGCNLILVKSDDVDQYQTFDDFEGKTVAAQANSIQEAITNDQTPATVEKVATLDVGLLNLQTGKVDGITLSCTVAEGYVASMEGIALSAPRFAIDDHLGNVVVAKLGNTDLIDEVNKIMDTVNEEGLYEIWYEEAEVLATENGIIFE